MCIRDRVPSGAAELVTARRSPLPPPAGRAGCSPQPCTTPCSRRRPVGCEPVGSVGNRAGDRLWALTAASSAGRLGLPGRAGRSSLESATRAALSSAEPPRLRWAPGGPLARVTARLDPGGPTAPTRSLVNTSSAGLPDSAAATLVVAVDGPSGAGKSTVSREVARRLGLRYLDTGAMYRAVAWAVLAADADPSDAAVVVALTAGLDLAVGSDPGIVGVGGIVVEGRDIGTVVVPDAPVKIFLTAAGDARAHRRAMDPEYAAGADTAPADRFTLARAELTHRDRLDSGRAVSPLVRAADAVELDSTDLGVDEVVEAVLALCAQAPRGAVDATVLSDGRA